MSSQFPSGKTVIGRITNTAVDTATPIAFKDINGGDHTFVEGERLVVQTIKVNNRATAKDLTVFQDTDGGDDLDTGEEMDVFSFAAAGTEFSEYEGLPSRRINAAGTNTFFAKASAVGAVDVVVVGEVIKS